MNEQIVQINFSFSRTAAAYAEANLPYADPIGQLPGPTSKMWFMNEAEHEAGGVYLFADAASAQAFLAHPLIQGLRADPNLRDLSIKVFDVLEPHTSITRKAAQAARASLEQSINQP